MNLKKLSWTMALLVGGMGTSALAADSIKLSCPAGSVQQLKAQQDWACVAKSGKTVAGPMVMLYPSGVKMAEGQIDVKGSRTGTWTLFDENGVKTHTIQFKAGNFDGQWVEFYPNGFQKEVRAFKDGLPYGQAQRFDPTGKVITAAR